MRVGEQSWCLTLKQINQNVLLLKKEKEKAVQCCELHWFLTPCFVFCRPQGRISAVVLGFSRIC